MNGFNKQVTVLITLSVLMLALSTKEPDVSLIYNKIVALVGGGSGESTEEITDLLEELGKIKTLGASRALLDLLDYYIGEHPHEILLELITKRGASISNARRGSEPPSGL